MIARVSSTTRVLVLGVVRIFHPVHGSDVRREPVSCHAAEWGNVGPGSISSALETLVNQSSTSAAGPSARSYRLTARALWTVKMPVDPRRDELFAALEARRARSRRASRRRYAAKRPSMLAARSLAAARRPAASSPIRS
jgi:hypothetical protein